MAMPDRVVVNASPLIGLLRIKREGLLPALFEQVFIPTTVRDEIAAGRAKDPNAARLGGLSWSMTPPDESIPEAVLTWALGRGESSVLSSAHRLGAIAVLDDLAARRCARFLEVPLCGTGRAAREPRAAGSGSGDLGESVAADLGAALIISCLRMRRR